MLEFNTLDDFEFRGRSVLLRVDINCPLRKDTLEIEDDNRIQQIMQTLKELLHKGAKVAILAHQGRPGDWKEDWENIAPDRRRNWINLAKRYPKMKPEEQQRMQRRMQSWAKLTPEQRKQAREKYRRLSKGRRRSAATSSSSGRTTRRCRRRSGRTPQRRRSRRRPSDAGPRAAPRQHALRGDPAVRRRVFRRVRVSFRLARRGARGRAAPRPPAAADSGVRGPTSSGAGCAAARPSP